MTDAAIEAIREAARESVDHPPYGQHDPSMGRGGYRPANLASNAFTLGLLTAIQIAEAIDNRL